MSLNDNNNNYILQNRWMLDLEDLHSIILNHSLILRIVKEQESKNFLPRSAL